MPFKKEIKRKSSIKESREALIKKRMEKLSDRKLNRITEGVLTDTRKPSKKLLVESAETNYYVNKTTKDLIVEGVAHYKKGSYTKEIMKAGKISDEDTITEILENYKNAAEKNKGLGNFTKKQKIFEAVNGAATNIGDIAPVYSYQIPMVIKKYWKQALKDWVSVQPIAGRTGIVRWLKYHFSSVSNPRTEESNTYLPEAWKVREQGLSPYSETAKKIEIYRGLYTDGTVKSVEVSKAGILDPSTTNNEWFKGLFNSQLGAYQITTLRVTHPEKQNEKAYAGGTVYIVHNGTYIEADKVTSVDASIVSNKIQYTFTVDWTESSNSYQAVIFFELDLSTIGSGDSISIDTGTYTITITMDGSAVTPSATDTYGFVFNTLAYVDNEKSMDATMAFGVITQEIETETFKLSAAIAMDALISANKQHNLELEKIILDFISSQLAFSVDQRGFTEMRAETVMNSPVEGGEFDATLPSTWATSAGFFYQFMVQEINMVAADIMTKSFRGFGNKILMQPKHAAMLFLTGMFEGDIDKWLEEDGSSLIVGGELNKKYDAYINPYWYDEILVGYSAPNNDVNTGAIYAPFLPLLMTPVDWNAAWGQSYYFSVYNISGFKVIDPTVYGIVDIQNA